MTSGSSHHVVSGRQACFCPAASGISCGPGKGFHSSRQAAVSAVGRLTCQKCLHLIHHLPGMVEAPVWSPNPESASSISRGPRQEQLACQVCGSISFSLLPFLPFPPEPGQSCSLLGALTLMCGPRQELLLCRVGISISCDMGLLLKYSFSRVLEGETR